MLKKLQLLLILTIFAYVLIGCQPTETTIECGENQTLQNNVCVDNEPEPEPDTTAPVFDGVHNLMFTIGEDTPHYLDGVTANDDVDGNITSDISVDTSLVNLTTAGEYTITYTVSDAAGNTTSETATITVSEAIPDCQGLVESDLETISLPETVDALYEAQVLTLPKFGANGTFFYWSTSDSTVITKDGVVLNPSHTESAQTITLSLRAVNGTCNITREYNIEVLPYESATVTSQVLVPFDNCESGINVPDVPEVELFYVDNGNVPYIDFETFVELIDQAIYPNASGITYPTDTTVSIAYNPIIIKAATAMKGML